MRAATQDAHHRLDHHPLLRVLVQPGLSRAAYTQALVALAGPQRTLESWPHGWVARAWVAPRHTALAADLADLGACAARVTPPPALPAGAAAHAAGYLLMGAGLGARVIARQLALHLDSSAPRRFFAPTTPSPHALAWLGEPAHTDPDLDAICTATQSLLAWLQAHLDTVMEL